MILIIQSKPFCFKEFLALLFGDLERGVYCSFEKAGMRGLLSYSKKDRKAFFYVIN